VALRRDLGLLDVTMIGVGAMIGTSIFVLIGVATAEVGAAIILVFVLNGVTTLFTAATYAELGSSFPEAGGGYVWAKKALPHPAGFLSGWLTWFAHTVACSYYSLGFGFAMVAMTGYAGIDFFGLDDDMMVKVFATAAILLFLGVNYIGVGATGKAGDTITLVQVLIIAFFVTFTLLYAFDRQGIDIIHNFDSIIPENRDLTNVLMVMGFTFIAFEGYDIIVQCGEEVKDPKRNIPRAILISVVVASVLYISVAFACLANQNTLPGEEIWNENTVINAAAEIIPYVGAPLLIFGGILSAMAALNATVFSSSRVSFAMGRDGSLPKAFGSVHLRRKVPHNATAATGMIMLVMALIFPLEVVVAATSIIFLLAFSLANMSSIRLRKRLTAMDVGFRTPLFPLIPVIGIISTLGVAAYLWWLIPEAWYIALVWVTIGLVASAFARPREEPVSIVRAKRTAPKPLTKEQTDRFRVFLALEDLGDLRLVEFSGLLARYFNGELTVNKIVEVPGATPLDAISRDYIDEISNGLKKAIRVAPSNVTVHPVVSVSHDVAGAIVDRTRYETANLLLLGWKGTRRRGRTILGRNLDRVVREAPCDVAIVKTRRLRRRIERVLLVSGGYFETRKALLLSLPLAREYGAEVLILSVITDERSLELARGNAERLSKVCARVKVESEMKFIHSKSLVNSVMEHAGDCDILVMGTGPQSTIERTLFGAVYDRIIRSVEVPVLVLKTARRTRSGFVQLPSSRGQKTQGKD
jgi:amino acid transporter/nucleotide-binding universal stress UspA family protein